MKPIFKSIDCISLKVGDLSEAIEFYSEKLGHPLKWKTETSAGLEFSEGTSELVLHTEDHPSETDLLVDSVPEAIQEFIEAGGKLITGPFELPVGCYALVSDPWNNPLSILDLSKGVYQVDKDKNVIGVGAEGLGSRSVDPGYGDGTH
jgi:predicted enzyme related to lactoylglutathione lyase